MTRQTNQHTPKISTYLACQVSGSACTTASIKTAQMKHAGIRSLVIAPSILHSDGAR